MPTTKFTTLANLDRYTTHVEEKNVQVTRDEYTNLPSSKLTDNRSYFIKDEGIVIKNGVEYGKDTIYTLSVGSGADANKITLTPSEGSAQSITVPYATSAGNANTVSNHTVAKDVPADAKFTDTTYSNATTTTAGLMSSTDKTKLDGVASGAEVNQNAFSNVKVGSTTVAADAKTDTIELVQGSNITLTPDATNDKITIAATNTTYSNATTSSSGLMSASDKTKLNGIAEGATANIGTVTSVGLTAGDGISVSGGPVTTSGSITVTNKGVRSVAQGTTNGTINVNTNGSTADVAVKGLGSLAYKSSLSKSDVGLGNVANLDQSKAIKSITRSGTTFTATAIDGTTSSFTQQDNNTTYSDATTATSGLMSASDKIKLNGVASGAEVNQNAFSNVKVGDTTVAADAKTDTLELVAGTNVTLTPDATNDKVTIAAKDTTYSANNGVGLSGTTFYNSGVRSITTGTSNGTINVNTNGSTANVAVKGLGSAAYTASTAYIASSLKGANNGVAELDSAGKVPSSQLPSFVDDVLEYDSMSGFPSTGEAGKIYVAKDTNKTYRWSGTAYVEISPSLALGETSSTAYRGDRGKTAYDHSQVTGNPHGTTKANVGLGNVANLDQSKAIKSITRSGTTFTATALDGTTSSFTQQDNNTTYTGSNGITLTGTNFTNSGVRSIAAGTANGTINVNTNGSTADVAVKGLGAMAYKASVSKSDVGLGNVANLDQSKAIKSITRSGTTFTATAIDGTTSSFTQQDNNTTYTGANGVSLSGTTFSNSGVRSIASGTANGTINVNTNGSTADVAVKGLGSAAYTNKGTGVVEVVRGASCATTKSGFWSAMCNSGQAGSPTLPTSGKWWHVFNMDWSNDPKNWVSQLAVATQDGSGVWWRKNNASETSIDSSTWYRLAEGDANGNANNANKVNNLTVQTAVPANAVFTDTKYTGANGVSLSGTTFSNSGVRAVATGGSNGTINVNTNGSTANVAVKGLGSAAYTASTNYATNSTLTNQDLNNVTAPGFYNAGGSNTCANKPSGIDAFGLEVIHSAGGTYYTQIIYSNTSSVPYRRNCNNGTWSSWTLDKYTDTNTTYSAGSNITLSGTQFSLTKANVTGALGYTPPTTNTTYSNVSTSAAGLAPKVTDTSKFLKGDGTQATPTNTTYSNVSTSAAGLAPKVTDTSKYLKGDGTWATPTNTTYSNVSSASAGLAPKGAAVSSQSQNTKFLREDGSWAKPSYTTNTDTKVTSEANHYSPAAATASELKANASGASAAWSIDVVKGVQVQRDSKGHVTGLSVTSGKIPANPNTDTKVTSEANHYSPTATTASELKASASGGTAAWSLDVVTGVQAQRDSKGHITGLTVSSGKLPSNPNTDTKVRQTLSTTNANYPLLLSQANNATTTANIDNVSYRANAIYANPSTGQLNATKFVGDISGGTGLTKSQVTTALGYTPPTTNTTYTGANGVSLSGTTFSNSGVRSIATGTSNGTINVNTNGSTANVAVKGLGSAAYTASTAYAASGHNHDSTYLKLSGGTMTGALNFANGIENTVGDDVSMGDFNKAGCLGIQGKNGETGITLIKQGATQGTENVENCTIRYNSTNKCIDFVFA